MNNLQVYLEELNLQKKIHENELEVLLNSSGPYTEFKKSINKKIKKVMKINNKINFIYEILKNNIEDESIRKT